MPETPEEIELESIEDLSDPRVLDTINYIVAGGDVYQLKVDGYGRKNYLKLVDEIPDRYWDRWDDA